MTGRIAVLLAGLATAAAVLPTGGAAAQTCRALTQIYTIQDCAADGACTDQAYVDSAAPGVVAGDPSGLAGNVTTLRPGTGTLEVCDPMNCLTFEATYAKRPQTLAVTGRFPGDAYTVAMDLMLTYFPAMGRYTQVVSYDKGGGHREAITLEGACE